MMRRVGLVVAARRMMAGSRSLSSVVAEDGKPYPCSWSWGRGQAKSARPLPQTPTLVYDSLRGCIHEWGSSVYLLRCTPMVVAYVSPSTAATDQVHRRGSRATLVDPACSGRGPSRPTTAPLWGDHLCGGFA